MFEGHLKKSINFRYYILIILLVAQKLFLKFIHTNKMYKMLIMILTYTYYGISYFLEFKVDFFTEINIEFIAIVIEYLSIRYVLILVDSDFQEFTMNKI